MTSRPRWLRRWTGAGRPLRIRGNAVQLWSVCCASLVITLNTRAMESWRFLFPVVLRRSALPAQLNNVPHRRSSRSNKAGVVNCWFRSHHSIGRRLTINSGTVSWGHRPIAGQSRRCFRLGVRCELKISLQGRTTGFKYVLSEKTVSIRTGVARPRGCASDGKPSQPAETIDSKCLESNSF
jgi:hypothetical protein